MKKLIFGLIATVMFGFVGNAQGKYVLDLKNYFPKEVLASDSGKNKVEVSKDFSKKYNGRVYIESFVENNDIKYLKATITFDDVNSFNAAREAISAGIDSGGCDSGYRSCARGCNSNPTTLGVALCIAYCMIDC